MTTVQVLELSSRCVLVSKDEQKITLNGENDQNVGNTPKNQQMPIQIITDNDDDLFNISDTVLKDITM